jgi:2,3,4,5-tetrahydropyridine-2-carboxylate N-succinyltransferase
MHSNNSLERQISDLFNHPPTGGYTRDHFAVFEQLNQRLNLGEIRAASRENGAWPVHLWVKQGILLGFRMGALADYSLDARFRFFDKDTLPLRPLTIDDGVRVVPDGSSIRDGVYLGRGVTCMPPMYINIGAYVDDGTLVDSHALVGSCAQVGNESI